MEQRLLEINVISARDLNDVNIMTKMDVYVVVSLSGDSQQTKTNVHRGSGTNPTWNFPVKFTINDSSADSAAQHRNLVFTLFCDRALGDKEIGQVNVPVKELLDSAATSSSTQFVSYQVRKPSGKPKGELHFSYKLSPPQQLTEKPVKFYPTVEVGPTAMVATPPWPVVGGYIPVQPGVGYGQGGSYHYYAPPPGPPPPPHHHNIYPPTPHGYGSYPPPPPPGYGYPNGPGYGYPPHQQGVGF
ncbi:protein SRC2 [Cannabis sativa]|uniref:C2 domain-containing protein n=1 Tax=Cannabis sativa TaxID=3483 RepID=A0A7J6HFM3_CANSA|nr:protein SRC2 [Cannabis sativa]KAF4355189.1 hypothetical protein F8388_012964 [Cannabis sativa]KAF4393711.1 hypothetical protein G4B88_007697 [Cannabis sativa]